MKLSLFKRSICGFSLIAISSAASASEKTVERLQEDIAELKAELAALEEQNESISKVVANIETAESEIDKSKEQLPEMERGIDEMEYLYNIYRDSFIARASIQPGTALGTFQLKDGSTVSNGVFMGTSKSLVNVQTAAGLMNIHVSQFPAEFSDKFTLPQGTTDVAVNYDGLKAEKPAFAKSKEEIEEEERRAEEAEKKQLLAEKEAEEAAKQKEREMAEAAQDSAASNNAAIMAKITLLKQEYTSTYNEKKRVKQQKYDQERAFRGSKIKKSQVHIDEALAMFDTKINALELKEDEIKKQITLLRSQMR